MGRTKNTMRNSIFGLVNKFVILIFPFIIRTIIIYTLGTEYVGLSSLFTSIISVLSMAELGFGSAIVYTMYKPVEEKNSDQVCALLNLYKTFYRIVGSAVAVIGICLLPFLKYFIKGTVPQGINIYVLFAIYLLNTVSSYLLFAYRSSLLTAHQRNDLISNLNTICQLTMYIVQVVALLTTHSYYLYLVFLPMATIINNVLTAIVTNRKYPQYKPHRFPEKQEIGKISKNVFALFGHKIGGIVLCSCDSIFISAFLGLTALAIYTNYYYILSSIIGILNMLYISVTASIGNSLITESNDKNYKIFRMLLFLNSWITCWAAICLLCLFQPFMQIWVGKKLMYGNYTVILMALYFLSWNIRKIPLTYKDAAGMWKNDFFKPYVSIVVDLALNYTLIQLWGVNGVIVATIVTMSLVNMPWETEIVYKKLFQRSSRDFYLSLFKFLLLSLIVALITWEICTFLTLSNYIGFIVKLMVCIIVPNGFFLIFLHKNPDFKNCLELVVSGIGRRERNGYKNEKSSSMG